MKIMALQAAITGYWRQVEADYFILLNSDVEVSPGWIEPVIDLMESDPLIAAAAPKIKSFIQKDHFEHAGAAGGFIDNFGYPFCRGRMFYEIEEDKGQYQQSGEVFWATGAAMFIKKNIAGMKQVALMIAFLRIWRR